MKLTAIEEMIIAARLEGISFSLLNESDKKYSCDQIMLKGAAISGSYLPQTEFFADIISEQLCEFIENFGYGELTLKEIILSIQLNAKGSLKYPSGIELDRIVFTGACFNVDFLSRILSNYLGLRNILDQKFKNFIEGY